MSNKPFQLHNDDCINVLKNMDDNSVDSIVTDPPYGLSKEPDPSEVLEKWINEEEYIHKHSGFMNNKWDSFVPPPRVWKECLRVLKPGGHILCFSGARTYDWMCMSLRLAGFEIRDQIMWIYGTGMAQGLNIGKAINKSGGDGNEWSGWNTKLKPAHEPIILARKPLEKGLSVASNTMKWSTGGINIDDTRVPLQTEGRYVSEKVGSSEKGRFPANVIHDGSEKVLENFPDSKGQQGELKGHNKQRQSSNGIYGKYPPAADSTPRGDTGSAARFFYCAKASKKDRNEGLDDNYSYTLKDDVPTNIIKQIEKELNENDLLNTDKKKKRK